MDTGLITGIVAAVIVIVVAILLGAAIKIVPQGYSGVITRFGRFRREAPAGLAIITPFLDRLLRVDMRETPRTGDRQDVITKDNVAIAVNATMFSLVDAFLLPHLPGPAAESAVVVSSINPDQSFLLAQYVNDRPYVGV